MLFIIDSHAWIEYLIGSKKGELLENLFKMEKHGFLTVECCLAEIKGWCIKNNKNFENAYEIIRSNSITTPVTEKNWLDAAEERTIQRKTQKDFGLIDSIILAKQKEKKARIISGDKHFEKLKNMLFLK